MMEISFYLQEADAERLFTIQEIQGNDQTAAEFARSLLEGELWRMFPAKPRRDEDGNLTNADKYQGDRRRDNS